MLYHLLRPIAITGINLFYNSISVEHQERIPKKGPVIFAANHPNTMMDPLIVAASCGLRVSFLARSPLFFNSFPSRIMRIVGIIPVPSRAMLKMICKKRKTCYATLIT
jgi:1-acyl-sn-glycerol-3-phosphate acyltransferase